MGAATSFGNGKTVISEDGFGNDRAREERRKKDPVAKVDFISIILFFWMSVIRRPDFGENR